MMSSSLVSPVSMGVLRGQSAQRTVRTAGMSLRKVHSGVLQLFLQQWGTWFNIKPSATCMCDLVSARD